MKCPKCQQVFEGRPQRCPHCNVKFKWPEEVVDMSSAVKEETNNNVTNQQQNTLPATNINQQPVNPAFVMQTKYKNIYESNKKMFEHIFLFMFLINFLSLITMLIFVAPIAGDCSFLKLIFSFSRSLVDSNIFDMFFMVIDIIAYIIIGVISIYILYLLFSFLIRSSREKYCIKIVQKINEKRRAYRKRNVVFVIIMLTLPIFLIGGLFVYFAIISHFIPAEYNPFDFSNIELNGLNIFFIILIIVSYIGTDVLQGFTCYKINKAVDYVFAKMEENNSNTISNNGKEEQLSNTNNNVTNS